MRALVDIFGIWDSLGDLAREIGRKYNTVCKWQQAGRIPPEHWDAVIGAARRKNVVITTAQLARLNRPRKSAATPTKAAA
jgi:hypothetical protein